MSESQARLEVRREFGPLALIEEACRDTRRVNWIEDRWRDLEHASRQLRRERAFAILAILTLALGIGAVTTIFSIVDTVLLKPLAYKDPARLYAASESAPKLARVYPRLPVNASHFRSWQEQCRSCESAALLNPASFNVTGRGEPEAVDGATCTWPLFHVGVLAADVTLPHSRYQTDQQRTLLHQRALEALEELPGVRSAGLISSLPLKTQAWGDSINHKGDTRPRIERTMALYRFVSEGYFQTMGIGLRQGRFPTSRDRGRKVAVISESAARKVWPGENGVGKLIRNDPKPDWVEIIGVVADVRTESLEKEPPVMVYVPYWDGAYWQGYVWGNATYVVRTAQNPAMMANAFRAAIHKLDGELPLANMLTMREILSESVGSRRFQTLLTALFASVALLLACLGIYGVISYSVARRTNEIGIRIAIGAEPLQVSLTVFRQGIRPVMADCSLEWREHWRREG